MSVVSDLRDWVEAPFVGKVSILDLFLITGIVLIAAFLWSLVLYHVRIAAETIVE